MTDRASGLRPEYPNHVWSYDFVEDRTHDGRKYRMLNIIDEFTRECLAIRVNRKLNSTDVIDVLSDVHYARRSRACSFRQWPRVRRQGSPGLDPRARRQAYIEPGSPWENGYAKA